MERDAKKPKNEPKPKLSGPHLGFGSQEALVKRLSARAVQQVLLPPVQERLREECQEQVDEMKFRILCKYSAEGYNSPGEYLDAEFDGQSLHEVLSEFDYHHGAASVSNRDKEQMTSLATNVVVFYLDETTNNDGTLHELPPLDKLWLEAMRFVCNDLNTLALAMDPPSRPRLEHITSRPNSCPRGMDILSLWKVAYEPDKKKPAAGASTDDDDKKIFGLESREELIKKLLEQAEQMLLPAWREELEQQKQRQQQQQQYQANHGNKSSTNKPPKQRTMEDFKSKLVGLIESVVDFYCEEQQATTVLPSLGYHWRKAMHSVCNYLYKTASASSKSAPRLEHVSYARGIDTKAMTLRKIASGL